MKEKPTPRDGDSRTYSWQEYQCDVAIIIDVIILLYGALSLVVGIIQIFQADSIFINIVINFTSATLFLSTYISRNHIANYWKVILLNLLGIISIVSSWQPTIPTLAAISAVYILTIHLLRYKIMNRNLEVTNKRLFQILEKLKDIARPTRAQEYIVVA